MEERRQLPRPPAPSSSSSPESRPSLLLPLDSTRHAFHTKMAFGLTVVTLFGLGLLSVLFGGDFSNPRQADSHLQQRHRYRRLDDNDYSSYSCHDLFDATPDAGDAQCAFARTCNQGAGLWAPFVFCSHNSLSRTAWLFILSPVMLLWLLLLFRMLGSTAEDYFSPSLEMFSTKLGLPPRFAGVTLLALGNGAADVSATVSAISNDPQNGYKLSLGALTGAAMVIGSVVSALVVLVAGGVPCRGALVRDVTALGVCVLIVWRQLGATGTVGPETVTLFLSLYAMFVVLVLVADVYHRAVVLPRKAQYALELERRRQLQGQQDYEAEQQAAHAAAAAAAAAARTGGSGRSTDGDCELAATHQSDTVLHAGGGNATSTLSLQQEQIPADDMMIPSSSSPPGSRFSRVLTAFSNYDNDPTSEDAGGWGTNGIGVDSDELAQERPVLLHGSHGILNPHNHRHHITDVGSGGGNVNGGAGPEHSNNNSPSTNYAMLEDVMDRACIMPGSIGSNRDSGGSVSSWKEAFAVARLELSNHAEQVWDDIAYNGDIDVVTKCCLILELPFTIARKMTVVIPCEGYYVRAMIALSLSLSPLWFAIYMYRGHEVNLFLVTTAATEASTASSHVNVWFLIYCSVAILFGLVILRFAPAGDAATGEMSLLFATPIALYGFIMAATWIDTIADSLVSLLDFIGIVLYIPGPIVGLTILAWGNSMSDLSADVTMARKGLANMAMTACFAGPFFNILVGLGLGFYSLAAQTGVTERQVDLSPSITVGFLFITINSAVILLTGLGLGKGRIPKKYGYIAVRYCHFVRFVLLLFYPVLELTPLDKFHSYI
jgi:solute carrier family 24 (sodium/potassium/calcium exchanger), member 6